MNQSFLSHRSACLLSEAIGMLYHEPGLLGILEHTMDAIEKLLHPSSISVELFLPNGRGSRHLTDRRMRVIPGFEEVLPLVLPSHPTVLHLEEHPSTPVARLSEFVTQRQLRNLPLWDYGSKLEGWIDQLAVLVPTGRGVVGFALNRAHAYTDEERLAAYLLHPHLARVLNRDAQYAHLPGAAIMTSREREVLHWIAQGKRDEEIATLLRCSLRTVHQHVRALLQKLGVENRSGAILRLLHNTSAPPSPLIRINDAPAPDA